jgi:hypothetical protein
MPDKPEDVRIKVAHQLLDSVESGTLAKAGVGGQHAGINHLLRLDHVRERSDRRATEDHGESPTIPQHAGGKLWLRRHDDSCRFLPFLFRVPRSFLVLKLLGVGHTPTAGERRVQTDRQTRMRSGDRQRFV